MGMRDLPDMYAQSPRDEDIRMRQITKAHVLQVLCNISVVIVTTSVGQMPQVIITLLFFVGL